MAHIYFLKDVATGQISAINLDAVRMVMDITPTSCKLFFAADHTVTIENSAAGDILGILAGSHPNLSSALLYADEQINDALVRAKGNGDQFLAQHSRKAPAEG